MSITLETVGKGLLIAGFAMRYGCLRTGIGVLVVSLTAQLLIGLLTSLKQAALKNQLRQSFHTH